VTSGETISFGRSFLIYGVFFVNIVQCSAVQCSAHAGCIILVCAHIKPKITKPNGPLLLSALRSYGGGVLHYKYTHKLHTVSL
jgi:hypothetical protein